MFLILWNLTLILQSSDEYPVRFRIIFEWKKNNCFDHLTLITWSFNIYFANSVLCLIFFILLNENKQSKRRRKKTSTVLLLNSGEQKWKVYYFYTRIMFMFHYKIHCIQIQCMHPHINKIHVSVQYASREFIRPTTTTKS